MGLSSRLCADDATRGAPRAPVRAGTPPLSGRNNFAFVAAKLSTRREGTPAGREKEARMWVSREAGSGSVVGTMSIMCHWVVRRGEVERVVGVIIHRITLLVTRGSRRVEFRAERNTEMGLERERRWTVQAGIVMCVIKSVSRLEHEAAEWMENNDDVVGYGGT